MICTTCKQDKSLDSFGWRKKGVKRRGICKECMRSYRREHYKNNKDQYKDRRRSQRSRNISYVKEIYLRSSCVDCGENDPVVLEFDHLHSKEANVSKLARNGVSLELLQEEIDKCEVRCANCHRRRTAKDQGWEYGK